MIEAAKDTLVESQAPVAFMMIGHQYCGKSTFVQKLSKSILTAQERRVFPKIYNLDSYVKILTEDYQGDFLKVANEANTILEQDFKKWLAAKHDIIFDRTNTTKKSRMKILKRLKANGYKVSAIVFPILDDDEIIRRMENRPDQKVPLEVVQDFRSKLEPIDDEERKYYDWINYL
jgi:predicted kinase